MKIEEVIGSNMRRVREERGLSQTDLGQAIEPHQGRAWSRQAVSAAEKGQRAFSAADLMALALVLDVSIPSLFLLTDWRDDRSVEIADGITVSPSEYRDRILHELDARGSAQLMTTADVQELAAAVIKMREGHLKAGQALAGLEVSLMYAGKAVKLADDIEAAQLIQQIKDRQASEQQD